MTDSSDSQALVPNIPNLPPIPENAINTEINKAWAESGRISNPQAAAFNVGKLLIERSYAYGASVMKEMAMQMYNTTIRNMEEQYKALADLYVQKELQAAENRVLEMRYGYEKRVSELEGEVSTYQSRIEEERSRHDLELVRAREMHNSLSQERANANNDYISYLKSTVEQLRREVEQQRKIIYEKIVDKRQENNEDTEINVSRVISFAEKFGEVVGQRDVFRDDLMRERENVEKLRSRVEETTGSINEIRANYESKMVVLESQSENEKKRADELYSEITGMRGETEKLHLQVEENLKEIKKRDDLLRESNEKIKELIEKNSGEVEFGKNLGFYRVESRSDFVNIPKDMIEAPIKVDYTEEFLRKYWIFGFVQDRYIIYYTADGDKKAFLKEDSRRYIPMPPSINADSVSGIVLFNTKRSK